MGIVIDPPSFDLFARMLEGEELSDVQTLIAQAAIEWLYVPILRGFSRLCEVELDAALMGPFLERLRRELRAMIDSDRHRRSRAYDDTIQRLSDIGTTEAKARLYQRWYATKLIDDRQHAKGPAIEQLIVDEIHTPALVRALRLRHDTAMQAQVFSTPDAHAQLQASKRYSPPYTLLVHAPTLPPQHHVNAQITEARTLMSDVTDPASSARIGPSPR